MYGDTYQGQRQEHGYDQPDENLYSVFSADSKELQNPNDVLKVLPTDCLVTTDSAVKVQPDRPVAGDEEGFRLYTDFPNYLPPEQQPKRSFFPA